MNKDVIYIDVDDDVTAIIGKIKKSKEKIVAVVPPKRVGTLQSAVNLRLLDRMARADKKQLVLITNNQALVALAANASIPVAKNLQSKPEIAEIPAIAIDDEDDIIDGAELPVGDHAGSLKGKDATRTADAGRSDAIDTMNIDGDTMSAAAAATTAGSSYATSKKVTTARSKVKIPNFDKFRKRLFFGIAGGILLVGLLIWMFVFAPAATVIVTAGTSSAPVSSTVKLGGTVATDFKTGVVKSISQQEKKDAVLEFDATGEKDLGTPAAGTVKFSTNNITNLGTTIPAGTKLTTSSGTVFATDSAVTMTTSNYSGANVAVAAVENGTNYNGATGSATGAPSGISAALVGSTAGGTSKIAKVATNEDVERAKGQLIGQSADAEKAALTKKFISGEKVIDSSFTVDRAEAVSAPAVGQEAANGKAKLTIATTYTIHAIAKADLETYLNASLNGQIVDAKNQKVYSTGIEELGLSNFRREGDVLTVALTTTGKIGPKIDESAIKEEVKGKIYGEVQSSLQMIDGVKSVDVKFSYPWVRTIPGNTDKIKIEFKLENE